MKKLSQLGLVIAALLYSAVSSATILTVYDDFTTGLNNFNSTVTGAGATPIHDNWNNLGSLGTSLVRTDYTVTQIDGSSLSNQGVYALYNSSPTTYTSGDTISINPAGSGPGIGAKGSGVNLAFNSAINSIGFEVGDWATCCFPSDLYISFDNGAPILVGHALNTADGYLTNGGAGVFVAAFDDSSTFSSVQFWGDGFGEYLVMGGTIHYATVGQGTLPPVGGVPEPASIALLGIGLLGFAAARRSKIIKI